MKIIRIIQFEGERCSRRRKQEPEGDSIVRTEIIFYYQLISFAEIEIELRAEHRCSHSIKDFSLFFFGRCQSAEEPRSINF